MAEEKYQIKYTGDETNAILDTANALRTQEQTTEADFVQVYDTEGIPRKIAKAELLKNTITPNIKDVSAFVAVNQNGDVIGTMSKEQTAEVLSELIGGLRISSANAAPDANRLLQEVSIVSKGATSNLPNGLVANGVLITIKAHPKNNYMIQFLFGLNDYNRYTRVKVDDNWNVWKQF